MLGFLSRVWEALTRRIDRMLFGCALAIVGVGIVTLFSASDQSVQRVTSQLLSFGFAIALMWLFANIPPQTLARAAVPLYVIAVLMLFGVAMFGVVVNGSRRWLNFGIARFQPSELMKIALPLMLAWYFQKFEGRIGWIDFVLAVFVEEFGLIGNAVLLILYLLLIGRGIMISANASTLFARLVAGAITLMFFTYAFVNMSMVSGLLPVVGVPLPLVSYGGTAMISLFIGLGVLMSVQAHRKLVAT